MEIKAAYVVLDVEATLKIIQEKIELSILKIIHLI
jgi:hypothetical protein